MAHEYFDVGQVCWDSRIAKFSRNPAGSLGEICSDG